MCYPELEPMYELLYDHIEKFQSEVKDLLIFNRNIKDRYRCIYEYDTNGKLVYVYIAPDSSIIKILINSNMDSNLSKISIFAEDTNIQKLLESSIHYKEIINILTQIQVHVEQDRILCKLKYNI